MRIHHLALRVASVERALSFYEGVLGLAVRRRDGEAGSLRAAWVQAGDAVIMLERSLKGRGPDTGSAHVLCFEVHALGDWERRFAAAGVAIDDRTPYTLYVADPDGHRVGVSVYAFGG